MCKETISKLLTLLEIGPQIKIIKNKIYHKHLQDRNNDEDHFYLI